MPRKTLIALSVTPRVRPGRAVPLGLAPGALAGVEERGDLREVLVAEVAVRDHHVVPVLGRVRDVRLEEVDAAARRADLREVGRAELAGALAQVRVAVQAAGLREQRRAGDRGRVVRKSLLLRPLLRLAGGDQLGAESLLRRGAL